MEAHLAHSRFGRRPVKDGRLHSSMTLRVISIMGGMLYPTKVRLKLMGIQKSRKEEEESQDLLRFETQDLDDQVLRAHIQNGYLYLQMSKHGVAPFRISWKGCNLVLHVVLINDLI
ncbi:hypothetical protein AMTRI_Chr07g82370 [Amborella trichopoda]